VPILNLSSPAVKNYYRTFPPEKTPWPILDITFLDFMPNQKIPCLVDSGASHSILHPDFVSALNINTRNFEQREGSGVGSAFEYWDVTTLFNVVIDGYEFKFSFHVAKNPILWPCILGENTIFSNARIDFQKYKGFFEIRYIK